MAINELMPLLLKCFASASHALIGEVGAWITVGITYDTRAHGQYAGSLLINPYNILLASVNQACRLAVELADKHV